MKLLEVEDLQKHFPVRVGLFRKVRHFVHAVDGVSLSMVEGETLGVVGESGCGKTTLAKLIMRFIDPDKGSIWLNGRDLLKIDGDELRSMRARMQMIFQDTLGSMNPRKTVFQILSQPYLIHESMHTKAEVEGRVFTLLEQIGMTPPEVFVDRYPHELSAGQRQRIVVARAIALKPSLVIADEPVSSLDVSVRAQILELMRNLQKRYDLAYLFITHDLSVIRSLADHVAIMYFGQVVEQGSVEQIFLNMMHPYTMALLSATPIPNPMKARTKPRIVLTGEVPATSEVPSGCRFNPRCPLKRDLCATIEPELCSLEKGHTVACHFTEEAQRYFEELRQTPHKV